VNDSFGYAAQHETSNSSETSASDDDKVRIQLFCALAYGVNRIARDYLEMNSDLGGIVLVDGSFRIVRFGS
jgi:hypothetical protein